MLWDLFERFVFVISEYLPMYSYQNYSRPDLPRAGSQSTAREVSLSCPPTNPYYQVHEYREQESINLILSHPMARSTAAPLIAATRCPVGPQLVCIAVLSPPLHCVSLRCQCSSSSSSGPCPCLCLCFAVSVPRCPVLSRSSKDPPC